MVDPVEFLHDLVLPNLKINRHKGSVVLGSNLGSLKLGLEEKVVGIAKSCAASATVPSKHRCYGHAGDCGFIFPDLIESATRIETEEVLSGDYDGYFSTNLRAEMGINEPSWKTYESILYFIASNLHNRRTTASGRIFF